MSTKKPARYNVFNGTDYDKITFETDAKLVDIVDVGNKITATNVEDALQEIAGKINNTSQTFTTHEADKTNPHGVTVSQIGAEPAFSKNNAFNKNFGTTAGTVCQGNDARLSDTRTPKAHTHTPTQAGLGNVTNTKQMPIAGGTFTGVAVAQTNTSYTTRQLRNVIQSTANPSGGSNGDIWIKYK